jgi:mRNA interferase MazF
MTRGEIFRLASSRSARGREQSGSRYGVIVQSDDLPLSTVLVAPTSTAALPTSFRPAITIGGTPTRIMVEQTFAMDIERLGRSAGRLEVHELRDLDEALSLALGL